MQVALGLARRGLGNTYPNPAVGCLLSRPDLNNRIVGRGWTQPGGRPHAETVALKQAGTDAKGATAYVTLEPCCHHGKTPPCSEALIGAGVARVVVALKDPDPRVAGQGLEALSAAGIDVVTGVCGDEAAAVNAGFISRITRNRPLFTLKTATTLDGRIATSNGDSQWITGEKARAEGHVLRASHDAILTGIGTIQADNAVLTCRLPGCEDCSPVRIILDSNLSIAPDHAVIKSATSDDPVWIFTNSSKDPEIAENDGVTVFKGDGTSGERIDPVNVAQTLGEQGMTRVLVESGGGVSTSFLEAGLIDEVVWFRAASVIGGDGMPAIESLGVDKLAAARKFQRISARQVGADMMETYRVIEDD